MSNKTDNNSSGKLVRQAPPASSLSDRLETALERVGEQETALRPAQLWTRAVTWGLIATTMLGVGFLAFAKTEEVVVARGKLEPLDAVKDVKIPIGGVTADVLVKEGEKVEQGQVLLRLDAEASTERQSNLKKSILNKQSQLQLKHQELERFLQLNDSQQRTLTSNLALQRDILARYRKLQQEGASAELQYLQQRDRVVQTQGELDQTRDERLRQQAILNQQIEQLLAELAELQSQLSEQYSTVRYQELKAPVSGMVFNLRAHRGYVAQGTEPVLQVVPLDALQAVVEIPSEHIGFVQVGQPADISIDSFPANEFGVLAGVVKRIGSDALPPDQTKQRPDYRFPADISLASQQLQLKSGRRLPLQAGMSLQANIKLRPVSYLQLLLGSFRQKADALRQI